MHRSTTRLLIAVLTAALAAPAAAAASDDNTKNQASAETGTAKKAKKCPKLKDKPFVYAIGSSTLGIELGPELDKELTKRGFRFRKWAKASSGLARPDFHDWPSQIPQIIEKHKPDVLLISLGTNDFQAVRKHDGNWVKPSSKEWDVIYARRIKRLLELASGKDRKRPVIWIGPTIFDTPRARRLGARVTRALRAQIKAFDGPAFLSDTYAMTVDSKGRPIRTFKIPGKKRSVRLFGSDHIHLTRQAVEWMMVRPVVDLLDRCKRGQPIP